MVIKGGSKLIPKKWEGVNESVNLQGGGMINSQFLPLPR
jgi:hypothetical protein